MRGGSEEAGRRSVKQQLAVDKNKGYCGILYFKAGRGGGGRFWRSAGGGDHQNRARSVCEQAGAIGVLLKIAKILKKGVQCLAL